MIPIYKDTKIYILLPAGAATAGPEILHQLAFYLRNHLNFNAYLYLIPVRHKDPIPSQYAKYNNPIENKIDDNEKNIIISPEIFPLLNEMNHYKNIRKLIWWLSLDNYFFHKFLKESKVYTNLLRGINKAYKDIFGIHLIDITDIARKKYSGFNLAEDDLLKNVFANICSARHVELMLNKYHLKNVIYISELINEEYLTLLWDSSMKEDIVAYNPAKGISFTKKILNQISHIKFVPIKNLNGNELVALLKRTKVYIDFGNHPGRDHLPREAAILGCCVITGRRGGAALFEDLAINDDYKFKEDEKNIPFIIEKINECINNYNEKIKDFEYYRQSIKDEPSNFLKGLKEYFKDSLTKL